LKSDVCSGEDKLNKLGRPLIIIGSIIGTTGAIVNTLWLNHNLAILIWGLSNPLLAIWSIGAWKGKWNDGLSYRALAIMYATFTGTGLWAIWQGL
jgi:hypothetical protein